MQPTSTRPLLALLLALPTVLHSQTPGAQVRITEIIGETAVELPSGYIPEPGRPLNISLIKSGPEAGNPAVLWSGGADPTGDAAAITLPINASGFTLGNTDRVKVRVSAFLLSKAADRSVTAEGLSADVPLSTAQIGRFELPAVKVRLAPSTLPPDASNAAPGVVLRVLGKLRPGALYDEHAPFKVRLLDPALQGTGKELTQLAISENEARMSKELDGLYARVNFVGLTLKPGQKLIVEASIAGALNDADRAAGKKPKRLDGRTPLTVPTQVGDLGILRVPMRN